MNLEEVGQILVKISAYTKMTPPGKVDIAAWHGLPEIKKMSFADAERAVVIYYQQHKSPMHPVDLIQTVRVLPPEGEVRVAFFGEPGEILCRQCHGVHYPHEKCSVLVPMPAWFREKYAAAAARVGIPVDSGSPPVDNEEMPF